jgi:hypothetical protein
MKFTVGTLVSRASGSAEMLTSLHRCGSNESHTEVLKLLKLEGMITMRLAVLDIS